MRQLLKRLVGFGRASPAGSVHDRSADPALDDAQRLIVAGNRCEDSGDLRAACEHYREAVKIAPHYAKAHLNLGIGLAAAGNSVGAGHSYRAALAIDPDSAPANYNLATLLYARGELQDAANLLRRALEIKPMFPEAHVALSNVYDSQGALGAAVTSLEAALEQRPDFAGALYNYGLLLKKTDRPQEAETAMRRAVDVEPDNAHACFELATLLDARGALGEAEVLLRSTLERQPDYLRAYVALSDLYESQGNYSATAGVLESALRRRPDWVGVLLNYGHVLRKLRRLSESEAAYRRVIALDPALVSAYQGLGGALVAQSRIADALEAYRSGRALDPESFDLETAELFILNYLEDLSGDEIFVRHKAFGERMESKYPRRAERFRLDRNTERRLRVGYVSGDFHRHPVALFAIPLLERHDRSLFEVYGYSSGTLQDDITRQVRSLVDAWRDAASMSDAELAEAITRDEIDILVDLSGHSGISRLGVFAQQPAPVQVSWLGYLNTTGLTRIQYRLCDGYTDLQGVSERQHTETLIRLPNSQWCYRPFVSSVPSDTSPFVRNGFVTFGSFHDAPKLSRLILRLWAEILSRLPEARLVLVGLSDGHAQDSVLQYFTSVGVAAPRITAVPRVALIDYFSWFNSVDIALDTIPYSGGTTTCDALWMGVPVITATGIRSISRSAGSILSTVGLTDWIASTHEDYVHLAVQFAGEQATLGRLRGSLRARMLASPLMDEPRFARDVENAYRSMWHGCCAPPSP